MASTPVDLVLCDVHLPTKNGFEFLATTRSNDENDPVFVMISGTGRRGTPMQAIEGGAHDYIAKPLDRSRVLLSVASALQRRRESIEQREAVERLGDTLQRRDEESLIRLVWAAESRDDMTGAHIRRIGRYAAEMARALDWPHEAIEEIRYAAPLHDIGKIAIPDEILRKPGPLTFEEFEVMQQHARLGADILRAGSTPLIQMAAEIALHHHENWDGCGYPDGLSGEAIPEAARIVSIIDVYDALVHDRPYRLAYSEHVALNMMVEMVGSKFEPRLYGVFSAIQPAMREIAGLDGPQLVTPESGHAQPPLIGSDCPVEQQDSASVRRRDAPTRRSGVATPAGP